MINAHLCTGTEHRCVPAQIDDDCVRCVVRCFPFEVQLPCCRVLIALLASWNQLDFWMKYRFGRNVPQVTDPGACCTNTNRCQGRMPCLASCDTTPTARRESMVHKTSDGPCGGTMG